MKRQSLERVLNEFKQSRLESLGSEKGANFCTRFDSVILRYVSPGLGGPCGNRKRMSEEERRNSQEYLKSVPATKACMLSEALEVGFELQHAPESSRRAYAPLVRQAANWISATYPHLMQANSEELLCPKMQRGRGGHNQPKTTSRVGRYQKYALDVEEMPCLLQEEFAELERYSLDAYFPGRVTKVIGLSSFERYSRTIRMLFAFRSRNASSLVPVNSLTNQDVCPHLTKDDFRNLSRDEQYRLQQQHADQIEKLLLDFFACRGAEVGELSPGAQGEYISVMLWYFRFHYRDQVRNKAGYRQFPVEQMLQYQLSVALSQKREWKLRDRTAVDISQKYPDFKKGQTQLESVQTDIVEVLRKECRIRNRWKMFRKPRGIATSLQRFIIWYLLAYMPARRQQDLRNLKLANTCLLTKRPDNLPDGGFVFPMPPPELREHDSRGYACDNFLIHVYEYNGTSYENGIWLWVLDSYKTVKSIGAIILPVPNHSFDDESYFYQYLEKLFFGVWTPRLAKEAQFYQGLDESLKGTKGTWATLGRNEFVPSTLVEADHGPGAQVAWHYTFLKPRRGDRYDETGFGKFFTNPAYRLTEKQITPHILRHLWATWGHQKGLSDQEIEALAFAMGHSSKTLKTIYQHLTSAERLQPLSKVLDNFYQSQGDAEDLCLDALKGHLTELTPEQRYEIQGFLEKLDE